VVAEDHHLILISDKGKLIRIRVKDVPIQGRATQGVRVMRLEDGEQVAAIERLVDPEEASDIAEATPLEAPEEIADGDTERVDLEGAGDDGEGEGDDGEGDGDDAAPDDEGEE